MAMRLLLTLLLPVLMAMPTAAQQTTVMQQITDIKLRASAEGVLTAQKMTKEASDSVFELCANDILCQLGGGYSLSDIRSSLKKLVAPRGSNKLVFVYLKTSDLGAPTKQKTETPQPVKETPQPEKEVTQPVKETTQPEKETTQPVEEVAQPEKEVTVSNVRQVTGTDQVSRMANDILQQTSGTAVLTYLKRQWQQGNVEAYGKGRSADHIERLYLVLCRRENPFVPVTVLTPVVDGSRIDMLTGETSSESAYPGCGAAIWFEISK